MQWIVLLDGVMPHARSTLANATANARDAPDHPIPTASNVLATQA